MTKPAQTGQVLRTVMAALTVAAGMASAPSPVAAQSKPYVDLELVLAVDISLSMDADEQRLQRDGYVAALRDPSILKAIQSGPNGRIALTYLEWAGAGTQSVVMPWSVIATAGDANAFADELATKPISRDLMTSVSAAIDVAADLFASSPVQGLRRVIDVSGDGPNNSGRPVEAARDAALGQRIVINGLAIRIKRGGDYSYFDLEDLDRYYEDCVIGGPGSFVLSIRDKAEFATAIRQKLLLEIAGREPDAPASGPLIRKTQLAPPPAKYDCLIGEKMWRQYNLDSGDPQ